MGRAHFFKYLLKYRFILVREIVDSRDDVNGKLTFALLAVAHAFCLYNKIMRKEGYYTRSQNPMASIL